jgi:response regulator RpfG family c-di-GMP phosphodiesterase
MNMPGMDGVRFLRQAKELSPDSVRMMLTGADDQRTAIAAVNEGSIFRFLTKPCPPELLAKALEDGIRQYRLVTAEHELLEKTLKGSIDLMNEILSLIDPDSFGRTEQARKHIPEVCAQLKEPSAWEIEIAAMMAKIGNVTVPPSVWFKVGSGQALSEVEQDMVRRVPEIGSMLLANIPRLEGAARIVLYQDKHYDGGGFPPDSTAGDAIPVGARILKLLLDVSAATGGGTLRERVLGLARAHPGWYDPQVVRAAAAAFDLAQPGAAAPVRTARNLTLWELRPGQTLRSDIATREGKVLIAAGHVISGPLLERLLNFSRLNAIQEPIAVE